MHNLLNEDQRDCLSEIINISYGRATSHIATILDAFAKMQVPSLKLITRQEMSEILQEAYRKHEEFYLSIQQFNGEFAGECIFLLDNQSAANLTDHLKDPDAHESQDDIVAELTNIVTSALIKELCNKLNADVFLNAPQLEKIDETNLDRSKFHCNYECIIMINTILIFEEQEIYGEVFILSHERSFEWLKASLDRAIDELFG